MIGQSVYTTPFVILLVAARLQGFDASLERAASDLGANTFQRLRLIVLPLILPAVLAGALFAFTLSLDEFIITYFLIGANVTLPIFIYTQIKFGITPEVNAVATMLLAGSLTLLALAFTLPFVVRGTRRVVGGALRAGRTCVRRPAAPSDLDRDRGRGYSPARSCGVMTRPGGMRGAGMEPFDRPLSRRAALIAPAPRARSASYAAEPRASPTRALAGQRVRVGGTTLNWLTWNDHYFPDQVQKVKIEDAARGHGCR